MNLGNDQSECECDCTLLSILLIVSYLTDCKKMYYIRYQESTVDGIDFCEAPV